MPSIDNNEWSVPPSIDDTSHLHLLLLPFKIICGCCSACLFFPLIIILSPILFIISIIHLIYNQILRPKSCDINWPLSPFTHSIVTFNGDIESSKISEKLSYYLSIHHSIRPYRYNPILPNISVVPLDQNTRNISNDEDLLNFINTSLPTEQDKCTIQFLKGYSSNQTILLISSHPNIYPLCIPRIISAITNEHIKISMEPRLYYRSQIRPSLVTRCVDVIFDVLCTIFFVPFTLLFMLLNRMDKIWLALASSPSSTITVRRMSQTIGVNDYNEDSPLCITSDTTISPHPTPLYTFVKLKNFDKILKMEKIIRATSPDLLISLFSGAMRRYFRSKNIKHPRNCDATVSSCTHYTKYCSGDHRCKSILLRLSLPFGIEGAVPRVWHTQKAMAEARGNFIPLSARFLRYWGDKVLPRDWSQRCSSHLYDGCIIHISFMRLKEDEIMEGHDLNRLLIVPPLAPPTRISIVFIQHQDSIYMNMSVDRNLIPQPRKIIDLFEKEICELSEHLKYRMLPLAQSTVLPDRLPSEIIFETTVANNVNEAGPSGLLSDNVDHHRNRRRTSIIDLNRLKEEIEDDLRNLGVLSMTDDAELINDKIKEIEGKIEKFHSSLKTELGDSVVYHNVILEREKEKMALQALLAPYKAQPVSKGHKETRKFDVSQRRGSMKGFHRIEKKNEDDRVKEVKIDMERRNTYGGLATYKEEKTQQQYRVSEDIELLQDRSHSKQDL